MTYIVTENCINCKFQDCVAVCPVDCFYEGENFLVIHPDECIDCGVCEPECPAEAIKPDTEAGLEEWLSINTRYSAVWPNIVEVGNVPADADEWNGKPGKASLLITGDNPSPPSTPKPIYEPGDKPDIAAGETYETDGARIALEREEGGVEVRLDPRPPLDTDGIELEGLLIRPGGGEGQSPSENTKRNK